MSDSQEPGAPVLVGLVVLYGLVPPAVLLAGLYGASRVLDIGVGSLVFVLTVVTVISWYLVSGTAQPRGAITGEHVTLVDWSWSGLEEERPAKTGDSDSEGVLSRYDISHALSPSYLTLVLTVTTIVGWIAVALR